ncbi:hypothetical protein LQZ19_07015 [Treponema primitia]|uniref:hypothetical protein n=1 Tax=Treponema primitia TaxID=88058 RepID=UPI003980DA07
MQGLTGKSRLYAAAALLVLVIIGAAVFLLARPRAVWLVDEAYREQWERILDTAKPPQRIRIRTAREDGSFPKNWYGFSITTRGPLERTELAPPVVIYKGLPSAREYQGALVLAIDPWMMFRDFKEPAISRSRAVSPEGGEGELLIPGRDMEARWAWIAQLLQEQPGIFPEDREVWESAMEDLFRNSRFQQGAETYGWIDALPLFYRSSPGWVYAPVSRIRRQPPQDTSNLEANRFPEMEDWHEFGIQADILWAVPFGEEKNTAKLQTTRTWLASLAAQTTIANTLFWIPAHQEGAPYNAVARSARLAWLSSSFVWQIR